MLIVHLNKVLCLYFINKLKIIELKSGKILSKHILTFCNCRISSDDCSLPWNFARQLNSSKSSNYVLNDLELEVVRALIDLLPKFLISIFAVNSSFPQKIIYTLKLLILYFSLYLTSASFSWLEKFGSALVLKYYIEQVKERRITYWHIDLNN